MNDDLTTRIYEVRLLNPDIQKDQEDRLLAKDIRISPSGALEFTRIFPDSEETYKGFYMGEYYVTEMDKEFFDEMKNEHDEHHKHHHHDNEDE